MTVLDMCVVFLAMLLLRFCLLFYSCSTVLLCIRVCIRIDACLQPSLCVCRMSPTRDLEDRIQSLLAENERLRNQLNSSSAVSSAPSLHYMYASPLVLLDSMGTTVIETFDPLRIETELAGMRGWLPADMLRVSVCSLTNLSLLKKQNSRNRFLHISMHTVEASGSVRRCAVEDDSGRGILLGVKEFVSLLSLEGTRLVFLNACKSLEIGQAIIQECANVQYVICTTESISESVAVLFASEFYPGLISSKKSIRVAFEGAISFLKNQVHAISQQANWFVLLENACAPTVCVPSAGDSSVCAPTVCVPSVSEFSLGFFDSGTFSEDFVGRQTEMVRLCLRLSQRRVCAVTGIAGIGKSLFLTETAKFFSAPGGRGFAGGVCVLSLPLGGTNDTYDESFLSSLVQGVGKTVENLKKWYRAGQFSRAATPSSVEEDDVFADTGESRVFVRDVSDSSGRGRIDSVMSEATNAYGLKSYKVFWAETFSKESDLLFFLKSYNLQFIDELAISRLFNELRMNGTQLQDWGNGRIIRVVHVVRLLVRGSDSNVLLEQSGAELRLPSKKFDPVTENVLEVASFAVCKEFGDNVKISRVSLCDRKPVIEISNTSPSYPGLATKYALYTVEVGLTGLPLDSPTFTTTEQKGKVHVWRWQPENDETVAALIPEKRRTSVAALELVFSDANAATTRLATLVREWNNLLVEWAGICQSSMCALILLNTDLFFKKESVCDILGKSLLKNPNLSILFSSTDTNLIPTFTTSSVSYKVVQFPLPPLQPIEAAVLFTRRIHRPLFQRDWFIDEDAPPPPPSIDRMSFDDEDDENAPLVMSMRSSRGVANLSRLSRHPLIQKLEGIPEKILLLAQKVNYDLHSINELV